ncbi:32 kDa beta-galactoside-binding lectin 32 kDa GBP [Triplophysa tibetana]|uniref:Galectin n=1 Tax=Triplophysa tibetana TaxID=1572043 RepID=A0A5A9MYQ4_9TELE|nr:32 kDa beta-galactoside-binding lectin 32 kDa GBP [Triplophysa tibetana]
MGMGSTVGLVIAGWSPAGQSRMLPATSPPKPGPLRDIALHFNPRYENGSGYVVHNTSQKGNWGSEERKYDNPFPSGQPFNLQILVTQDAYKISTNGGHFMDFRHRVAFSQVDTISVNGKVELNSIGFQNPATVPYKTVINGGLYPGKNITIQGIINPNAYRIKFNLRHGSGIALHYNPRFDENLVVRNSLHLESWGSEERFGGMPFQKGQPFQVTLSCNPHHFNVFVGGQQAHTYNHRFTKLNEIDILEVSGDLQLTLVQA